MHRLRSALDCTSRIDSSAGGIYNCLSNKSMTYFVPKKHKCDKCGFEMEYSESLEYPFLPVSEDGNPFCYKCLIEFISKNVPEMRKVQ